MAFFTRAILWLLIATLASCTASRTAPLRQTATTKPSQPGALVQSALVAPKAELHLDQLTPALTLPPTPPKSDSPPPLEALELFGHARQALLSGGKFEAVAMLSKAVQLDGNSYELYYALGQAYSNPDATGHQAIAAFQQAVRLRPGSLEARLQLALQFSEQDEFDPAIENLRLARLSPEYQRGGPDALMVDLLLGKVLQHVGYEQAALDEFEYVRTQIDPPSSAVRGSNELLALANQPSILFIQIADLAIKRGHISQAINALQRAIELQPRRLELQAMLLQTLAPTADRARFDQAVMELLTRFRASDQSIKLLREVYSSLIPSRSLVQDLQRIRQAHQDDVWLLIALVDELQKQTQEAEAEQLLTQAAAKDPGNLEIIRRLVLSLQHRGQTLAAARWLIESSAAQPDLIGQTASLWARLMQIGRADRLQLKDLREIQVSPDAQAAKWYWASRLAQIWNRRFAARQALQNSIAQPQSFAPAYRDVVADTLARDDLDEQQKIAAIVQLAQHAKDDGNAPLACEVQALLQLHQKQIDAALINLAAAMDQKNPSPELSLTYADALLLKKDDVVAEQVLWQIIDNWPTYGDAYLRLFDYYIARRQPASALKVLQTWTMADPGSIQARLLEAIILAQRKQTDAAERVLIQLLQDGADDPQILATLRSLYVQNGHADRWVQLLQKQHQNNPDNLAIVQQLVTGYVQAGQMNQAMDVLDKACIAAQNQPDVLYFLAHLYSLTDHKQVTNEILQQVIKLDPNHAGANNDLGYAWADEGVHLDEAEQYIRIAIKAEPDNYAFLDSLAWVLYKREKFDEARQYLELALSQALRFDPVVLDHYGDVLYRLNEPDQARQQWEKALGLLAQQGRDGDDDEQAKNLRAAVEQKLDAYDRKEVVKVAPVAAQPVDGALPTSTTEPALPE